MRLRRGARWRRSPAGQSGVAVFGTAVLHASAGFMIFTAPGMVRRPLPPVYAVQLVAAPRPQPEARRAPEVVERPAERPAPIASQRPRRTSVAEPAPPPAPTTEEREPAPRTTPNVELAPGEEPSTGSDPATVNTEGVPFAYPEYLRNLVAQVHRQWQRPKGNQSLRAEVLFFVHRDGSISNLQFVKRSGNFGFDLEAQGAIEAAANAKAFGPLPDGYANDVLPVSFFFDPTARRP